ncbi:MAG: prepilin-type N-terminal cleavage/methylation domain-containing protein [Patescibacteria group bacterium]
MKQFLNRISGQSLIELIIALTIGGIFITAATSAIYLVLRNSLEVRMNQIASFLAQEYFDNINAISQSRWLEIYCPPSGVCPGNPKGSNSQFHLIASSTTYVLEAGASSTVIEGENFTRYFSIENINRDSCGIGNITNAATSTSCSVWPSSGEVLEDPSTQKVTIIINWKNNGSLVRSVYLTRNRNFNFKQSDWSDGSGQEFFPTSTGAAVVNNKFTTSTNMSFSGGNGGNIYQTSTSTSAKLTSSVFEFFSQSTGQSKAAINTISWNGNLNGNPSASVKFQIAATSSPSGPWNYYGPDGTSGVYYETSGPGAVKSVNLQYNNNYRYFRYKIFVSSTQPYGPKVDEINISWSP